MSERRPRGSHVLPTVPSNNTKDVVVVVFGCAAHVANAASIDRHSASQSVIPFVRPSVRPSIRRIDGSTDRYTELNTADRQTDRQANTHVDTAPFVRLPLLRCFLSLEWQAPLLLELLRFPLLRLARLPARNHCRTLRLTELAVTETLTD